MLYFYIIDIKNLHELLLQQNFQEENQDDL